MTAYMDHKNLANTDISDERRREIEDGVKVTLDRVHDAEHTAYRDEGSVTLLAATKTRDVGEILAAIDAGIRCIGENRPQEVLAKAEGLIAGFTERNLAIPFHMIGQLQANKISKILPFIDTVESVDSLKLAERIARRLDEHQTIGVLLEVNESGEDSKSGCKPEEAEELAYQIAAMPGLELQGFMTIGTHVDDEKVVRSGFNHLRQLRDDICASGVEGTQGAQQLSMGMSADMAWAIAEGATIVRVGTGIFGQRAFI
ncbi:YggS family pyridoxal phosphate-dependent enzyme [Alloscardovia venturai]|uniref:Pyridoxal phosphate homeostasis protein n=1 Tax=Alloscardovia venturai TaxID=1769421 RepID=A0ABW2Y5W0_9BIFI